MARNLIFQFWQSRPVPAGALAGSAAMEAYAKMVGADYRCAWHQPWMDQFGVPARWFDKLRPAFDLSFADYGRVLVVDHDVFPVDGLTENIFELEVGDFGMCEEPDQPEIRGKFPSSLFSTEGDRKWALFVEKKWGCRAPKDDKDRPRTWNAGLILFTREGMEKLRAIRPTPREYVAAVTAARLPGGVTTEQGYLNTLAFIPGVKFTPLPCGWNQMIHNLKDGTIYDRRNHETKFCHIMFRAADHHDAEWHRRIVNNVPGWQGQLKSS